MMATNKYLNTLQLISTKGELLNFWKTPIKHFYLHKKNSALNLPSLMLQGQKKIKTLNSHWQQNKIGKKHQKIPKNNRYKENLWDFSTLVYGRGACYTCDHLMAQWLSTSVVKFESTGNPSLMVIAMRLLLRSRSFRAGSSSQMRPTSCHKK
jgi:hypothetical protein